MYNLCFPERTDSPFKHRVVATQSFPILPAPGPCVIILRAFSCFRPCSLSVPRLLCRQVRVSNYVVVVFGGDCEIVLVATADIVLGSAAAMLWRQSLCHNMPQHFSSLTRPARPVGDSAFGDLAILTLQAYLCRHRAVAASFTCASAAAKSFASIQTVSKHISSRLR